MDKMHRKRFFAAMKGTKLLCIECKEVKKVTKYVSKMIVTLECGHLRTLLDPKVEDTKVREVLERLDDPEEVRERKEEQREEIEDIDNCLKYPWNQEWYDRDE